MTEDKIKFMRLAIKEAQKAYAEGEIPIGVVLVKDGKVFARAHNQRNKFGVSTKHAEIIAIEKACKKMGDWRLEGVEMYVTLEPCPMCAGAVLNSRIEKVYFGAYEKKSGAVESNFKILDCVGLNHRAKYEGGILEKECAKLLIDFFREKRE